MDELAALKVPSFKPVSDHALLVEIGTIVDDDLNRQIISLDQAITRAGITGLCEVVPAMVNLLIVFDPLLNDHKGVQSAVEQLFPLTSNVSANGNQHVVNVCYENAFSPDLSAVANACNMSIEAVMNAHLSASYRVSMYGFAPGYAYLSGVQKAIQVPRKTAAVRDIPAGSVIIAGAQCLTTTLTMPTGWSIIGRSNAKIITGNQDHPFLFDVGDTVSFRRISSNELTGEAACQALDSK
ncbi:allophanate hydrolase subunit 1 [Granulosicoccus sp.]|nr:allophanate hydrolase subunit 1 [Granulosicoccus sp.]MDB4223984.1 allophanate hydrolase subunit 1 [Granulosicoccus sp.]